jgi:AraC-like DNA-binding protein
MASQSDQPILANLLQAVQRLYEGASSGVDDLPTGLPWVSLVRRAMPTAVGRGMLQPSVCLLVQGDKEMLVGEGVLRYGPGAYVQAAMPIPVAGRIVRASGAEPYYGIRIDLHPKELAGYILEMQLPVPPEPDETPVVTVEPAGDGLLEAFLRLLRLLGRARGHELAVLGRLLKQEIMYHLVTAPGGTTLTRGVLGGQREHAVSRAISWIREHYDEPLKIPSLAKAVHLSPSVLHRRFKMATVMSPLQYQKQVRLLEARKLLMSGDSEAATVAYQVGYESPSQFSREYRRLFGASPIQDAQQLRGQQPEP